jgi:AraC family transcriptional activator of pobA
MSAMNRFHLLGLSPETSILPILADEYTIIWLGNATGTQTIDFEERTIDNDSWTFVTPGQLYALNSFQTVGTILTFDPEFLAKSSLGRGYLRSHPLYHQTEFYPSFVPEGMDKTTLDILIKLIAQEYKRNNGSPEIVQSYLSIILEIVARVYSVSLETDPRREQKDERAVLLNELIEDFFSSYQDTRYYASKLELTPKRANEIYKESNGKTIIEAVHDRLNLEMKRKIGYSTIPFQQIALELGFKDASYFSRFFKKKNKCSPQEFRDKCTNSTINNEEKA